MAKYRAKDTDLIFKGRVIAEGKTFDASPEEMKGKEKYVEAIDDTTNGKPSKGGK